MYNFKDLLALTNQFEGNFHAVILSYREAH